MKGSQQNASAKNAPKSVTQNSIGNCFFCSKSYQMFQQTQPNYEGKFLAKFLPIFSLGLALDRCSAAPIREKGGDWYPPPPAPPPGPR